MELTTYIPWTYYPGDLPSSLGSNPTRNAAEGQLPLAQDTVQIDPVELLLTKIHMDHH